MGVDPWADENDERETREGDAQSSDEDASELEREARRRRQQFWNEGYREGVEEGKKGTVQAGFNEGFREGATAGLAYGQARGTAHSVRIFAGRVPGSSDWKKSLAKTIAMIEEMTPRDAAKAAGADFEKTAGANARERSRGGTDATSADSRTGEETLRVENRAGFPFFERIDSARAECSAAGFEQREFTP